MDSFLSLNQSRNKNQFKIDYPYYGLFGTAQVKPLGEEENNVFECKLINGAMILLKRITSSKWIDVELNIETPLASIIGTYIDDFIKKSPSADIPKK